MNIWLQPSFGGRRLWKTEEIAGSLCWISTNVNRIQKKQFPDFFFLFFIFFKFRIVFRWIFIYDLEHRSFFFLVNS